ncbi:glycoside hydrolase domain-containing protein [Bacteroidota bacterium]
MQNKQVTLLIIAFLINTALIAQDLSYSKPGNTFYPELANPAKTNTEEWAKISEAVNVSFASDNVRYPKEKVPLTSTSDLWEARAWKGEKVHTQILVWTKKDIAEISFRVNDLTADDGSRFPKEKIKPAFVRYTMSDDFGGGCADRDLSVDVPSLMEDPIDIIDKIPVQANTVRPIWLSVQVPGEISAGKYKGSLIIHALKDYELTISLEVLDHILPPPSQWSYDFDIWQYPAPIARIHDVELWSEEHFELMRPYFEILANAGQKVISANIIEQPWGLDHVHFDDPSLIKWTKKTDGSWEYDFSMFDRYISFVMDCGITQRINCYSMITWDLSFIYYDEASGKNNSITLSPGSDEYTNYWKGMLEQFTSHLKEKGWFGKTSIAVDERPVESMKALIALLKGVDPDWRIALAGDSYHPEIERDIYDYCLASYLAFGDDVLKQRKAEGRPTTYYTACPEEYPNGHTFSPPAENAFLGWHAAAKGYTGYLFWAFNTWVANPLQDARWRRYPSGDLFQFYPGPRTSIRFEKLREGIQDFEKIRILREEFEKDGNEEGLMKLEQALSLIKIEDLDHVPAAEMVEKAKEILNQF